MLTPPFYSCGNISRALTHRAWHASEYQQRFGYKGILQLIIRKGEVIEDVADEFVRKEMGANDVYITGANATHPDGIASIEIAGPDGGSIG